MAIGRYKVVKVFESDGVSYALGNQLALDDKDAKPLLDTGKVILAAMLDPEDPQDAATIRRLRANPATFKAEKTAPAAPVEETVSKSEQRRRDALAEGEASEADADDESEDAPEEEKSDKPAKKGKK